MQHGHLYSDKTVREYNLPGTAVGMSDIKDRRLNTPLSSYPDLMVGNCVPFYFCPRSIMLYLLHMGNHQGITYSGGQDSIIHLVFDAYTVMEWCNRYSVRWALTLSNAGSAYFEDRKTVDGFDEINWVAIEARKWSGNGVSREIKEAKQSEFLVENSLPWELVEMIGVCSQARGNELIRLMAANQYRPKVITVPAWYY